MENVEFVFNVYEVNYTWNEVTLEFDPRIGKLVDTFAQEADAKEFIKHGNARLRFEEKVGDTPVRLTWLQEYAN